MDYIDSIIAERIDHDESQRMLAKKIGVAAPQIARYETKSPRAAHPVPRCNLQLL